MKNGCGHIADQAARKKNEISTSKKKSISVKFGGLNLDHKPSM
jgi:hypothetical protein